MAGIDEIGIRHDILDRAIDIDTQLDGSLVQVPFYASMDTIVNDVITLFQFNALGGTIRDIFVSIYLPLQAAATFTPYFDKTRAGDLVTFTQESPIIGGAAPYDWTIATPGANRVYPFRCGEVAQGLQGRFRIAQDNAGAPVTVDAFAVALMVV
jgi:hypothetical protein